MMKRNATDCHVFVRMHVRQIKCRVNSLSLSSEYPSKAFFGPSLALNRFSQVSLFKNLLLLFLALPQGFFVAAMATIWGLPRVRTNRVFFVLKAIVFLPCIGLIFLFPLFYVSSKFYRFLYRDKAKICVTYSNLF